MAARLSALSSACKALQDARKGGKTREARLDKALSRLERTEAPDLAQPGATEGAAAEGGAMQQPASLTKAAQTQATVAAAQVW